MDRTAGRKAEASPCPNIAALGPQRAPQGLFQAIFEENDAGLLILDGHGRLSYLRVSDANPTMVAWLGVDRQELIGRTLCSLLASATGGEARWLLERAAPTDALTDLRVALAATGGAQGVEGSLTLRPVIGGEFGGRMIAVFRRDDGGLSRMLAAARRERDSAHRARRRLLAQVSHDLRTPLNGILGFAEMLERTPLSSADPGRVRAYAADISAAGHELLSRVEDLLSITESDRSSVAVTERETVDLAALVETAAQRLERRAVRRGVAVSQRIEPDLPAVHGHAGSLARMIDSLLDNALRASPPRGLIEIACGMRADGALTLICADQGAPISLEDIEAAALAEDAAMDVYSISSPRSSAGLPTARLFAERNGATFEVDGRAGGTGFRCTIAFAAERQAPGRNNPGQTIP